jgi:hypothetical protein
MPPPHDALLQHPVRDAEGARALIAAGQQALRMQPHRFRSPPPEPTTCCGRGCNGCVWEGYVDAVEFWRIDLLDWLARDTGDRQGAKACP